MNIKTMATSLASFFLVSSLAATAVAQWRVKTTVDAMTDRTRKEAIATNPQGNSFAIYRLPDGQVLGLFALNQASPDILSERPPMYRVDKNDPKELRDVMKYKMMVEEMLHEKSPVVYDQKPKWLNFTIWHGNDSEGICGSLAQLLSGRKVVFRYWLFTGGYKDTTFDLTGAKSAILEAIGSEHTKICSIE